MLRGVTFSGRASCPLGGTCANWLWASPGSGSEDLTASYLGARNLTAASSAAGHCRQATLPAGRGNHVGGLEDSVPVWSLPIVVSELLFLP
jgi:hypothetical protein